MVSKSLARLKSLLYFNANRILNNRSSHRSPFATRLSCSVMFSRNVPAVIRFPFPMLITASAISSWQSRFANCRMASKWSTLQIFKMDKASVHPMRTIFANREAVSPYVLGCSESCQSSSSFSSFSLLLLGGTPLGAFCIVNELRELLLLLLLLLLA